MDAAAAVIRMWRPDIVTLDEVCRSDVAELRRTMSGVHPAKAVAAAFEAAGDRLTNGPYRCRNGQAYGIGVVAALRSSTAEDRTYGGQYPVQDLTDPEERVWVCISAAADVDACATHTASTSTAVALAQCRYFLRRAVPRLLRRTGDVPVVLGADLNLPAGRSPGVQRCVPGGYRRADDGSRQDVVASASLTVTRRVILEMHHTTDHPALLVDLAPAPTPVPAAPTPTGQTLGAPRPSGTLAR